jgi:hypothetical protein
VEQKGACTTGRVGRPRKYQNRSECDRAYRARAKERARIREEMRGRLYGAARGHVEPELDVEPIRRLLDRSCDLEADILPTVARTVPELPRALKSWGAQWLVQEILAARERQLGLANPPKAQSDAMASEPDGHGASQRFSGRGSSGTVRATVGTTSASRSQPWSRRSSSPRRRAAPSTKAREPPPLRVFSRCFRRSRYARSHSPRFLYLRGRPTREFGAAPRIWSAPAIISSETPNGPLLDQPLAQPGLARERDDAENAEYTVSVDWIRTVPVAEAKWLPGLFANQNIVCKLRDRKTLEFLRDQFGITET